MYAVSHDPETAILRARVAALEGLLAEHERAAMMNAQRLEGLVAELSEKSRRFDATVRSIADGIIVCDTQGKPVHYNEAAESILGMSAVEDATPEAWSKEYGLFLADGVTPCPPEDVPLFRALRGDAIYRAELFVRHPKKPSGAFIDAIARTVWDDRGQRMGAVVVFRDISERKRHERELSDKLASEREKNEMLERLRLAVNELSTPILEVWDDVLALPLIGVVDSKRAEQMMTRLLQAVVDTHCQYVIIDVTGVHVLDTATADHLLKMVKAVDLLGARCVLSGIRPSVAQTLVDLGVSFGSLVTLRNLKHGLRTCMHWREETNLKPARAAPP